MPRTATGSRSSSLGKSVRGVPLAGHQRAVSAAQVASPRGRTGLRTTRNSVRSVTLEESTSNTPVPLSTELSTEETIATTTDVSTVSSALSTITPSEEDLPSIATIPDLENLNALRLRFETNRTTFVRTSKPFLLRTGSRSLRQDRTSRRDRQFAFLSSPRIDSGTA